MREGSFVFAGPLVVKAFKQFWALWWVACRSGWPYFRVRKLLGGVKKVVRVETLNCYVREHFVFCVEGK